MPWVLAIEPVIRFAVSTVGYPAAVFASFRSFAVLLLAFAAAIAPRARAQDAALPELPATLARGAAPSSLAEWQALQARVLAVLQKVRPAVVSLGGGSGVIVGDGLVLTAAHVVQQPGREVAMTLDDGRRIRGISLGVNATSDAGLVRITTEGEFPHCEMGTLDDVDIGDWCLTLGHPSGRRPAGPPLRLGRVLRVDAERWLVTDCTIQAGDSGGPLFDLDGAVIGIHSRISGQLADNMHVPIAAFHRDWDRLLASESVPSARRRAVRSGGWIRSLGATIEASEESVTVGEITGDSAASKAGLQSNDVVIAVDGRKVEQGRVPLPRRRLSGFVTLRVRRGATTVDVKIAFDRNQTSQRVPSQSRREAPVESSRNDTALLAELAAVVATVRPSVVRVRVGARAVAFGIIVSADGLVLTKASELGAGSIECELADGSRRAAERVATDSGDDAALLRMAPGECAAIEWSSAKVTPGLVVLDPTPDEVPAALGVLSLEEYAPRTRGQGPPGELGIVFAARADAPRVMFVREDSAAQHAGLRAEDLITEIDEVDTLTREAVVQSLDGRHEGEIVRLRIIRDGAESVVEAKLSGLRGGSAPNRNPQEPLWGPLSTVRTGFSLVLAHDSVLTPEQCGGPLVTLDGHVVGWNVARTGRVETTALPATHVRALVERLIAAIEHR